MSKDKENGETKKTNANECENESCKTAPDEQKCSDEKCPDSGKKHQEGEHKPGGQKHQKGEHKSENQDHPGGEPEPAKPSELDEVKNALLRTAAEFDNYKKRTTREKESLYSFAASNTIAAFLPVFDSFERAVSVPCGDENYKKGCELIFSQLRDALTKLGVSEMDAVGKKFDPEYHNAVMHIDDESVEDGTVVEVLQKGYLLGDKVIRHAMVKVAN